MLYLFKGLIHLGIISCLLFANSAGAADEVQKIQSADLTWSEFDGAGHAIWFSSWQQKAWAQPKQIVNDRFINIHPQVYTAPDGSRLLAWTTIEDGHFSLRYSQQKKGVWSDPKIIPSKLSSNIAPSVLIDEQNVSWIVWAGNNGNGELDDIYFSRLMNGVWTPAQRINPPNNVPDILPQLSHDDTGQTQVTWQSYYKGSYQPFMSTWDGHGWTEPQLQSKKDMQLIEKSTDKNSDPSELTLPEFVPDPQRAFLRKYITTEHP
jgi:hypothetical protein